MSIVITDEQEIKKLHKLFHKKLNAFFTERIRCRVGFPGGSMDTTVQYSQELDIWVCVQEQESKYWNGFGIGRPKQGRSNSLNGEINFDYEGSKRVAGAFAVDNEGKILILHTGTIGGGKKGIGKNFFLSNFRGDPIKAIHDDKEVDYCLVGELNSPHFPEQVSNFIREIYRVKNLNQEQIETDFGYLGNFKYTDERSGSTVTESNDPRTITRTHGIVVNALHDELERRGLNASNDRNRDLFIHHRSRISTLFEVKTSSSTQCLYQAVGQLLLYSIPIRNPVKLVAVLPDRLSMPVARRFASLGISVLYYSWENNEPVFIGLDDLLML
ncbi:hypothetical protein CNR22_23280 [Sphingobacteriaceae bacterium]|nr:hypothetical protein CNR22_23280 [Sphingobacteriaceae bacterium]